MFCRRPVLTATSVATHPGGECVRVRRREHADLGHRDAGGLCLPGDGFQQPALGLVARLPDELHAHGPLGHELRHRQGNEGAAESDHGGQHQQRLQIQVDAVFRQDAFEAQQLEDHADEHQNGRVGRQEKQDSHHVGYDLV
jgi:hypothetical protein